MNSRAIFMYWDMIFKGGDICRAIGGGVIDISPEGVSKGVGVNTGCYQGKGVLN